MIITDVKVEKIKDEKNKKVRGVASIVIEDCLAIHNIKIIEGKKGLFLSFPSRYVNGNYKDIVHPINDETREKIQLKIINIFNSIN